MTTQIKPIVGKQIEPAAEPVEVIRPVSVLESSVTFNGERVAKGKLTPQESIRLSVALVNTGEQSKARGIFVAAGVLKTLAEKEKDATKLKKEAKAFRDSLCAQFRLEAKEAVIKSHKGDANSLEAAKKAAEDAADVRYANLSQAINAAVWMLRNPDKLADSVSVFTVVQANRFLEVADKDKDVEEAKFVQAKVLPLLAEGITQGKMKEAIAKAKEDMQEARTPVDTRTPEQKLKDAEAAKEADLVKRVQYMAAKISACVDEWNVLAGEYVARGQTMEATQKSLSGWQLKHDDAAAGTIASKVKVLAILAQIKL